MQVSELQNDIIKRLLSIEDAETLMLFKQMLLNEQHEEIYRLSEEEKRLISESMASYKSGKNLSNDAVFKKNEEWLRE